MNNIPLANSLSVSVRIYRALLIAYPKKFREHYETQMVQVFRDSVREAYHYNEMPSVIDLWLHTFVDLVITALVEHVAERSKNMFSQRMVGWGSIASAIGGFMWLLVATAYQIEAIMPMAFLLTLGGLIALQILQGKQAGSLSRTGFILGILGTAMVVLIFVWDVLTRTSYLESFVLTPLPRVLGVGLFGISCILVGLRTLQTKIPPHVRWLTLALGILQIGFSVSLWLVYYSIAIKGIDPWYPPTSPAYAFMLLTFPIGILWMAMGISLAANSQPQISDHPQPSA
jgi:hypothetical protein